MTGQVLLIKTIIDKMEEKVLAIPDLDAKIVKYFFSFENITKDTNYVILLPSSLDPDIVSSHSDYPEITIDLILAFTMPADNDITEGNENLIDKLNDIYDVFHQKDLDGLTSDVTCSIDFSRRFSDLNSNVAYAFMSCLFRKYSNNT